ncbi:hypothetical protein [Polaromonas sp. YR568]|uniref:hypothetical protein n=1 Tax=Polaromonas sp. YR568 TaxID=1855301 RepID=UPI00398BF621
MSSNLTASATYSSGTGFNAAHTAPLRFSLQRCNRIGPPKAGFFTYPISVNFTLLQRANWQLPSKPPVKFHFGR